MLLCCCFFVVVVVVADSPADSPVVVFCGLLFDVAVAVAVAVVGVLMRWW